MRYGRELLFRLSRGSTASDFGLSLTDATSSTFLAVMLSTLLDGVAICFCCGCSLYSFLRPCSRTNTATRPTKSATTNTGNGTSTVLGSAANIDDNMSIALIRYAPLRQLTQKHFESHSPLFLMVLQCILPNGRIRLDLFHLPSSYFFSNHITS